MTPDEKALRAHIENWGLAMQKKDTAALTAEYAEDSVLFDCKPPYKVEGRAAIKGVWDACMPFIPAGMRIVRADERLEVGVDMAYYHGLARMQDDAQPDHPCCQQWIRVSLVFRKENGTWLAVHEHVSAPYNPMTDTVAPITDLNDLMCGVDYSTCEAPNA